MVLLSLIGLAIHSSPQVKFSRREASPVLAVAVGNKGFLVLDSVSPEETLLLSEKVEVLVTGGTVLISGISLAVGNDGAAIRTSPVADDDLLRKE